MSDTSITATVRSYFQLTKPTIMLLVVFTGVAALVIEGSMLSHPFRFILFMTGLYLTGGSANALNQYFEREVDARMARTMKRRPLPLNQISAPRALVFSVAIGIIGVVLFAIVFNWLTAVLSMATILFYSLFYTLYLKPRTAQNIVIGGAAGAMSPIGAWAAATGSVSTLPLLMFLIVFLWTPPHFWALALFCKDDYVKTRLPMMPVVKGDARTLNQILWYSIVLVLVSIVPLFYGAGVVYFVAALVLGGLLVEKVLKARQRRDEGSFRTLFGFSIIYLFALFAVMVADALLPWGHLLG